MLHRPSSGVFYSLLNLPSPSDMRLSRFFLGASAVSSLSYSVYAITLSCDDIVIDGRSFNLKPLGGPHSVHWIQDTPPSISNFTFTVDICKPLKRTKGVPKKDECPTGTRGEWRWK